MIALIQSHPDPDQEILIQEDPDPGGSKIHRASVLLVGTPQGLCPLSVKEPWN